MPCAPLACTWLGSSIKYTFTVSYMPSIAAVQILPAGVYVAMNGRVFAWDRVRKHREAGTFEEA